MKCILAPNRKKVKEWRKKVLNEGLCTYIITPMERGRQKGLYMIQS